MNAYEQMRAAYLVELEKEMPETPAEILNRFSNVLDRVAQRFDVAPKETALTAQADPIPELVKTYIIVKKTEGLSKGTLTNYLLILRTFFYLVS